MPLIVRCHTSFKGHEGKTTHNMVESKKYPQKTSPEKKCRDSVTVRDKEFRFRVSIFSQGLFLTELIPWGEDHSPDSVTTFTSL